MSAHNRRQFIRYGTGAAVGAVLLVGGWWQWLRSNANQAVMTATGLGIGVDGLLASLDGTGLLGQWVIAEHPDYDQPIETLAQRLRQRLSLADTGPVDQAAFNQQLQQHIQQDFATGDLLVVQDWQLSITEGLAAALRFKAAGASSIETSEPAEQQIVEISNWGPRTTAAGESPNSFGEGFSALWFDAENAPRWAQIEIQGRRLQTTYRENRVLVGSFKGQLDFQKQLFSQPGEYPITLHDDMTNRWQTIGIFVVTGSAPVEQTETQQQTDSAFCPIKNWGPKQTSAGVAQHPQANGAMGLWIDIDCVPDDVVIQAGEQALKAYANGTVVTTAIPVEMFQKAGEIPLKFISEATSEQLNIGTIVINP